MPSHDGGAESTSTPTLKELDIHIFIVHIAIKLCIAEGLQTEAELKAAMGEVMREGLEGLVLKGVQTVYEPGKRHWLKVKKDYLEEVCVQRPFSSFFAPANNVLCLLPTAIAMG